MDPNANLEEMLHLAHAISDRDTDVCGEEDYDDCVDRLAELVLALDEWLMRGGFLPTPWRDALGLGVIPPTNKQMLRALAKEEDK